jgi:hypothetical protein
MQLRCRVGALDGPVPERAGSVVAPQPGARCHQDGSATEAPTQVPGDNERAEPNHRTPEERDPSRLVDTPACSLMSGTRTSQLAGTNPIKA